MKKSKMPCKYGGNCMEEGGYTNPPGMYWNGERYVKHKGSGTYSGGSYFQGGGPTSAPGYYPPKQQPGYWKFDSYADDGGNIQEIQYGGYIPAPITAQPHILKQTDGVYHMATGGYIPAPIGYQPQILKTTDGVHHMQYGGAISNQSYNGVYSAKPGAPIKQQGGPVAPKVKQEPGYWTFYPYSMDGGNITEIQYGGPVNEMKKGGIHIKPENKGKFTAWAKSHGMGVQEAASHVMANKDKYSSTIVKRANFAKNAAGWKHEYGGPVTDEFGGTVDEDTEMKKGGNWIKGAVNPAHKGYYQQGGPLLPNNPSGFADSVINANQDIPLYRDIKAGKAPKYVDFIQENRSPDDTVLYGNGYKFLPHGTYVPNGYGHGSGYLRNTVNPYMAGMNNEITLPSRQAADIFQQEIEKRMMSGKKTKQYGGGINQYEVGGTYEVDDNEYNRLKSLGYKIKDL